MNSNYIHVQKLNEAEQKKLYMTLEKEELADMLIQANKHLELVIENNLYKHNGH